MKCTVRADWRPPKISIKGKPASRRGDIASPSRLGEASVVLNLASGTDWASRQRLANLPATLVRQTNSYAFAVNFQPPAPYRVRHGTVHQVAPDNVSPFVRLTFRKLVKLPAQTSGQLFDPRTLLHYT